MTKKLLKIVTVVVCALAPFSAFAYNNTSLEWRTIETEHFEIHYHEGAEWTAQEVARVAEEVHGPLVSLYGYEPKGKVHFVVRDTDDYANGAAYFFDDKVEIWATNLEFGFRGTSSWVRNVVTHEYCHIISIQASLRMPKRIPAIYFQWINFETEKRPDVLQGYPNVIVSYPYSGVMIPPWFAEGVAQYQSPNKHYDCWDTHRDMILRAAVLDDDMLTYDEMGFFGKSGHRSEQVYDHGYGLVNYIVATYGPEVITEVTSNLRSFYRFSMDGALKKATGKDGKALYADWKAHLADRYERQTREIRDNARVGQPLASDGYMNVAPSFSPDGRRIAYLSNEGSDYSLTAVRVMDRDGKNQKTIKGLAHSAPRFSPDGGRLLYSRKVQFDRFGSTVNDLFAYDFDTRKEKRLTRALRAADPDFSPDGEQVVCVVNGDGNHRIVVMDADGSNQREVYVPGGGVQVYTPHFSPDGKSILFGIFEGDTRDVALIDADGSDFRYVMRTPNDERDARWTRAGTIVFACDRTGIFNVYELNLNEGTVAQLTNVIGGAFAPDLSPDGDALVYSRYGSEGYGVYLLKTYDPVVTLDSVAFVRRDAGEFDECGFMKGVAGSYGIGDAGDATLALAGERGASYGPEGSDAGAASKSKAQGEADITRALSSSKYGFSYTPLQFYPRLLVWDGHLRFGAFMSGLEVLEKQSLFVGGSYGTDGEFDAIASIEIRNLYPTIFADFIALREKTTDSAVDDDLSSPTAGHSFDFDVRYDLWNFDVGLKLEFWDKTTLSRQHDISLWGTFAEYRIDIGVHEFDESGARQPFQSAGWKYYVGKQVHAQYIYRNIGTQLDAYVNPRSGRSIGLHYMRSFDELFEEENDFAYGLRPIFTKNEYNQYTVDWREYVGLPFLGHALRLRLYASVIDENVDDFFWTYLGGMDGIRGYTYYSIGGRKGMIGSLTYRFPILRGINRQLLHLYFRDLYGAVFFEAANAWEGGNWPDENFKHSVGYELRAGLGSFYIFPTAITFTAAYALDPVVLSGRSFGSLDFIIAQEQGWSYYFTMGFGFDL